MKLSAHELKILKQPPRFVQYKHGALDVAEVVDFYEAGTSINKLAFEYKASEPLIRKILVDNDVRIRNRSEAARGIAL